MATSIDMASNALVLIGDDPISALSESVAAENLYASTYEYVLSEHPWSFAMKEQYLSRLSQTPDPETNYAYAFQMPADLVVMRAILPVSEYRIVGDLLFSNHNKLLARYTYRVSESALPPHFVEAMEYKLASKFSISVAEDENKMQMYNSLYRDALSAAMTKDAQQHPSVPIMRNPIRMRRSRQ